jgi:hypothetical protein
MSHRLISHSLDLKHLRDDGYDLEIKAGYLLVKHVPYVNSKRDVAYGTLVSQLDLNGDVTTTPQSHVAYFVGDHPCNKDGSEIVQIKHQSGSQRLDRDLVIDHSFSSKPANGYKDYYEKVTTYAAIISSPAQALDPNATACTFPVIEAEEENIVFNYIDTASSRAGISLVTRKLESGKIAIVGLGGTGSYVLDLVAKTPVREIHLFDGDTLSQHNAFRSPGAPSVEELRQKPKKVVYLQERYVRMHRHIIAHDYRIDDSNVDHLSDMDFVFLCLDNGAARQLIVGKLEVFNIPFIDVGMGVELVNEALLGVVRVTSSTPARRDHVKDRIPFSDGDDHNVYAQNIQVADLNALNAALAVIKWKKLSGFYLDLEKELHSTYTIDGNCLANEVRA